MEEDPQIRSAAFNWLSEQTAIYGDVLPRRPLLEEGFVYTNQRIPLVSAQGIFKPRVMDLPLSITTSPDGPYDDSFGADGFLSYRYRGRDPNHRDNVGLRELFHRQIPLIYFHGIVKNQYLAVWPVFIVGDDPATLTFRVAVDDARSIVEKAPTMAVAESDEIRRAYLTASVRQRLHQRGFREKVLMAYQTTCAFCRLRHRELLDAAHIIPDREPQSKAVVSNGIALCKLHHATFDNLLIGVTPEYQLEVRADILDEEDGPILQHGLKGLHGSNLVLPVAKGNWPGREFLEWRYERFRRAG